MFSGKGFKLRPLANPTMEVDVLLRLKIDVSYMIINQNMFNKRLKKKKTLLSCLCEQLMSILIHVVAPPCVYASN